MLNKQSPFRRMLRFRIKKGSSLKSWQVATIIVFSYLITPYLAFIGAPLLFQAPYYVFLAIGAVVIIGLHIALKKFIRPQLTSSLRPAQTGMLWMLALSIVVINQIVTTAVALIIAFGSSDLVGKELSKEESGTAAATLAISAVVNLVVAVGIYFASRKSIAKSLHNHALNEQSAEAVFENASDSELRMAKLSGFSRGFVLFLAIAFSLLLIPSIYTTLKDELSIISIINVIAMTLEAALLWVVFTGYKIAGPLRVKQVIALAIIPIELGTTAMLTNNMSSPDDIPLAANIIFMSILYIPMTIAFCWYALKRLPHEQILPSGRPNPRAIF